MNCKNTELYMDALLDNELSVKDNLEVLSHIETCSTCKEKWDLNEETRTELKMFIGSIKAPVNLKEKIFKKISYKNNRPYFRPAFVSASIMLVISLSLLFNYAYFQTPKLYELHNIVNYQLISEDIDLLSRHIGVDLNKGHLSAFEKAMFTPHAAINITRPFNKKIRLISLKNDKGQKVSLCFLPKGYNISSFDKTQVKGITVHHGSKNSFNFAYWNNNDMNIALISQDLNSMEMIDLATPLINEV